jgi:hypothetical protein
MRMPSIKLRRLMGSGAKVNRRANASSCRVNASPRPAACRIAVINFRRRSGPADRSSMSRPPLITIRTELGARQLDAGIGDDLHQLVEVRLRRKRGACSIEDFERATLFGGFLLGRLCARTVAEDLYEAGDLAICIANGGHFADSPEPAAALPDPPPFGAAT